MAEKNDPKIIDSINTLIDLIPKKSKKSSKEEKKGPAIFGNLYNDKGPEEEEKFMLSQLSNIQWVLYPFTKMIKNLYYQIIGKKPKY